MTVTYPRTDIISVDFADQSFELMVRQELGSRQAAGPTYGKSFGSGIWQAAYVTGPMPNDDAVAYAALLNSLDGVIGTFEACDLRRQYPRKYPDGTGASDGVLASVNASTKALSLSGLAASQVISVGDYLSFDYGTSRALHQAVETVMANSSGVTAQFEVKPAIRPGWTASPATTVKLKLPRGVFSLVPGSVASKQQGALHSVVSFQAIQTF